MQRSEHQCLSKCNCRKFSEQACVTASERGLAGILLEFGLCGTGLIRPQHQASAVISQSEGTGWHSGLAGIPGGKKIQYLSISSIKVCVTVS